MNLMLQTITFNAYTNVETVSTNAYTIYMKLLFLNNDLRWREWFSITYERLGSMANIKSTDTVANAINFLEQKGFIEVKHNGSKKPNEYKIVPIYDLNFGAKDEQKANKSRIKDEQKTDKSRTKDPSIIKQNKTKQKINKKAAAAAAENPTENFSPATLAEDAENENGSLTLAEDKAPKDEFAATVKVFEENFHAVGKTEKQELHALFLRYGAIWLTEAIKETVLSGGRSVRYIKAILERWQKDGFKSKTKGGSMRGITAQSPSQDGIDDFGEAELRQRRNRPWDLQPKPGGGEGV